MKTFDFWKSAKKGQATQLLPVDAVFVENIRNTPMVIFMPSQNLVEWVHHFSLKP